MLTKLLSRWLQPTGVVGAEQEDQLPPPGEDLLNEADRLISQGQKLEDEGQFDEANALYRRALEVVPHYSRAYLNIGNICAAMGNDEAAEANYRLALQYDTGYGRAYANLGALALQRKEYQDALDFYTEASRLMPSIDGAECIIGVAHALAGLHRFAEAVDVYRKALKLVPGHQGANFDLGKLLVHLKRTDEAVDHFERFLSLAPSHAQGQGMLGKLYSDLGMSKMAIRHMELGCNFAPDDDYIAGMRLFTLNYDSDYTAEMLFEETKDFAQRFFSKHYPNNPQFKNIRERERRLKIGYVSADFKRHPVAAFVEPLFEHHDRSGFEIHAWYSDQSTDEMTDKIRSLADGWHLIADEDDASVFERVQQAGIDILIDLSGLTERHKLSLFALKPAPIQATWLGYLGSTGMETMDYRICDIYTDPPGMTERFHTEKLARLSRCQWSHAPYDDLPEVGGLPFERCGHLTFGSFNNIAKLNDHVLILWAEVLRAAPGSHLRIAAVSEIRGRSRILNMMVKQGISRERIEFLPRVATRDYLVAISGVDVALDPFPYNGGTTSLDLLMMGVPFITLAGKRSVSRGGVGLLSNVGLTEFIAESEAEYVSIAKSLADDPGSLSVVRTELRDRMERSILLDNEAFTRELEDLYRHWWRDWCDS